MFSVGNCFVFFANEKFANLLFENSPQFSCGLVLRRSVTLIKKQPEGEILPGSNCALHLSPGLLADVKISLPVQKIWSDWALCCTFMLAFYRIRLLPLTVSFLSYCCLCFSFVVRVFGCIINIEFGFFWQWRMCNKLNCSNS